ncbi:adenosylcobinamide-GDP ribazoletransferase, partial [Bacillus sp. SIMBA_161]
LAIMRDSRVGSYGVAAIALSLLLRATALAALSAWPDGVLALIGAHALSRAVFPAAMRVLLSARPGGLGEAAGRPSRTDIG